MKIAILGYNQEAVSCAHELLAIGAEVILFAHKQKVQVLDHAGLKIVCGEIKRVQKRFLNKDEELTDRSRLADLFRIIYLYKPSIDYSEDQEFWEKFKAQEKDHAHLMQATERFMDSDLIIDMLKDEDFPAPMGAASTFALNEQLLQDSKKIFYGQYESKDFLHTLKSQDASAKKSSVVIVGTNSESLKVLMSIDHQLFDQICVVTSEKDPWAKIVDIELKKTYQDHLSNLLAKFSTDKNTFQTRMNEWKSLEDYIQIKTSKPTEPKFPLIFHTQSQVTAVDSLSDQDALFLTVETYDFEKMQGNHQTLTCCTAFVATGYQKDYSYLRSLKILGPELISAEPGYYFVSNAQDLPLVLEDLKIFFSQV